MKRMKRAVCAVVAALLTVCAGQGEEPASIEGQVLLRETGEPVAGATVILLETGALTITDRQGEFKFEGVQPGRYHLHAHLDSALRNVSQVVLAAPGETVRPRLLLSFSTQRTQITVSAAGRPESAFEAFQSTHSLTSLDLARAENIAAGLGEAIGNQPGTGISWRGFGPGSSRPLIRGFDGDRVLIMTDDLPTGSISSNSGDHAETFNPLAYERVEVVKGPATLLYGSNAMGGVVNAISSHTGFSSHPDGLQGYLQGSGGTANALGGGAAGFDYAQGRWRLWGGANGLRTGDYATPTGPIENSRTRSTNGYGGFGWFGDRAFVSFGIRANEAAYGNPFAGEFHGHHHHDHEEEGEDHHDDHEEEGEHEDEELRIDLEMHQQAYQVNWGLRNLGSALESFVMKLNYATYWHEEVEFEGSARRIGTRFDNDQFAYRGVFEQNRRGPLSGRFGFSGLERDYSASGEEALAPPVDQQSFALFALEELDFERVKFQFGGRLETSRYNPAFAERAHGHEDEAEEEHEGHGHEEEHHEEEIPDAIRRRFTGASAAAGMHTDLWQGGAFVANYSHSYRVPALEELYNLGPHVGTLIFEVGDPSLKAERGNGLDLSLRQQAGRIDGEVNLFYYDFSNFVFPFATGEEEGGLPVVHFVQRDSRFTASGGEAWHRLPSGLPAQSRPGLGGRTGYSDSHSAAAHTSLAGPSRSGIPTQGSQLAARTGAGESTEPNLRPRDADGRIRRGQPAGGVHDSDTGERFTSFRPSSSTSGTSFTGTIRRSSRISPPRWGAASDSATCCVSSSADGPNELDHSTSSSSAPRSCAGRGRCGWSLPRSRATNLRLLASVPCRPGMGRGFSINIRHPPVAGAEVAPPAVLELGPGHPASGRQPAIGGGFHQAASSARGYGVNSIRVAARGRRMLDALGLRILLRDAGPWRSLCEPLPIPAAVDGSGCGRGADLDAGHDSFGRASPRPVRPFEASRYLCP